MSTPRPRLRPPFIVKNRFLKRVFAVAEAGLETVEYMARPGEAPLARTVGAEASVTLMGERFALGAGNGFRLIDVSHNDRSMHPETVFTFACDARRGVLVDLVFEAPDAIPVLMKRVRIRNASDVAVRIDGIGLGSLVPETKGTRCVLLENDYVRDGMLVDGQRVYSPWIEHHNDHITRFLNPEAKEHAFGYPVAMDWWLAPGETFESFRVFEFIVDNGSEASRGLDYRRITRALFPWTRDRWLACSIPPARNPADYYRGIDSAAEAGYEGINLAHCWIDGVLTSPLFTNYNDYEPRPELFPNGWEDVQKLTNHAHAKGLKISFYSIYVNTWKDPKKEHVKAMSDHRWQLVFAEDDKSSRWGFTLDPATDWGLFVNRKMEEAILKGGFDQYHLDGPYYGDLSVSQESPSLPGGPNQVRAWQRQREFYRRMLALNIPGEAAQGFCAFANGMSRITTTGYNEGDFGNKTPQDQVLNLRNAHYAFTRAYRPEQATTFVAVNAWSPSKEAPHLLPMEDHVAVYQSYLATCFGYGFESRVFQPSCFDGPKSKAAVQRWLDFWKAHEPFFKQGHLLHVRHPDGVSVDAIVHVLEQDGKRRALVVAFNPTAQERTEELTLPLESIGWRSTGWTAVSESGAAVPMKKAVLRVTVPALNATWFELAR